MTDIAPTPPLPRITILLCTFNGAAWLQQQLDSYLAQDHADWDLWVSDDGSQDGTWNILTAFQQREGAQHTIRLLKGPGRGGTTNFLSLLCHPDLPPGSVALSDQDDVWHPQKLRKSLLGLKRGGTVTLYGAQYTFADASLTPGGMSQPPRRSPCFANALTQNVISGHTATLSPGALKLVRAGGVPEGLPYHDWWLYQLITGAGGDVVTDPDSLLLYRQHDSNVLGAHRGLRASLNRIAMVFGQTYGQWLKVNWQALQDRRDLLTPEHAAMMDQLIRARARFGLYQSLKMRRYGLFRQTRLTTLCLYLAAVLGRL